VAASCFQRNYLQSQPISEPLLLCGLCHRIGNWDVCVILVAAGDGSSSVVDGGGGGGTL